MNNRNLLIAASVGAVVTTALANIPILNLLNCLLCLPFWGGPLLAVWYYKRRTGGPLALKNAIVVGTVAGLFAGVLGILLSFVGMAGASGLASQLNQVLPEGSVPPDMLAGAASFLFNLMGVITNIIFGAIGGLIGGSLFKDKAQAGGS
jgi:uncharacterized membrane protein YeaQ/YmgE (transglycosylase-associated protein family)